MSPWLRDVGGLFVEDRRNQRASTRYQARKTEFGMRAFMMLVVISVGGETLSAGPPEAPAASPGGPGESRDALRSEADKTVTPQIAVKRVDPARVVRQVHVGPYWSAARKYAAVREYMREHDQPGPMYARHRRNPTSVSAEPLRTEIGFFVGGIHEAKPPYEMAERPAELVAFMYVEGRLAATARRYAVLREWAIGHGYTVIGPITEIYARPGDPDTDEFRMELQMPVRVAEPEVAVEPTSTSEPPAAPLEKRVSGERAEPVEERLATPTSPSRRVLDEADQAPAPSAVERREPAPVKRVIPVRELMDENRFDRIAEQLLPDDRALPPDLQVWLALAVLSKPSAMY